MGQQTINDLNYLYYHAADGDRSYLLLHGIRDGIGMFAMRQLRRHQTVDIVHLVH